MTSQTAALKIADNELRRLRAINAELVAALRVIVADHDKRARTGLGPLNVAARIEIARAALAQAGG